MVDFFSIQNSTENPTFLLILYTVLFSFLLSSLIAFTYEKTSRQVARPDNYIQALVLIAIVAATVMQAIGDSLARGLGMLGALSIIRFRTTLRNPRNIVFMFGSLAAGIACGFARSQVHWSECRAKRCAAKASWARVVSTPPKIEITIRSIKT